MLWPTGHSALWLASRFGMPNLIKVFAEHGGDVDEGIDRVGESPLHIARSHAVVEALLDEGANIEARNRNGGTSLMMLARYGDAGDPEAVSTLIARGVRHDARDADGLTALHHAARGELVAAASMLVEAGADLEAVDGDGLTPLNSAAGHGTADMVGAFLSWGAALESRAEVGWTPRIHAAAHGTVENVEVLLNAGADIESRDNEGRTALMTAAQYWA